MTLYLSHWVPVKDKGSKIPCLKFWAMKISQSDHLHQEYLTIDLGNTSDWIQLQLLLVRHCERWRGRSWATWAYWGRKCRKRAKGCQFVFQTLLQIARMAYPQNLSQLPRLGSAIFRMQGADGCDQVFLTSSTSASPKLKLWGPLLTLNLYIEVGWDPSILIFSDIYLLQKTRITKKN